MSNVIDAATGQSSIHTVDLIQIISAIPALAWCCSPDGSVDFLNKSWHEFTGLTVEEAHGWGWQKAVHPDDRAKVLDKWMEALTISAPGQVEARYRRFDGIYQWFLVRANPLRDESGKIVKWYGTHTDIDDLKRTEEKLRRSEAFLAEGQRLSQAGNFSWSPDTDEITMSDEFRRILEFEPDTRITFERIQSRLHPDEVPVLNASIVRARGQGGDFDREYRLQMPDGRIKHVHVTAHFTRDRLGRVEYIGAAQDITQRKRSEEALYKARSELAHVWRVMSLGAFTASIAHEVNQPLFGIITNTNSCLRMLAANPPNVEGAREAATLTLRDGNRASDVISRLRALFGKRAAVMDSLNLNDAVREVVTLSQGDLQRARVVLQVDLSDDLQPITGDRIQLQQVMLNLLRNAADAMSTVDDRPRRLLISTSRDNGDCVCFSVQDTGVGLKPAEMDRLFEAFYTTKQSGMGIGLTVCRPIIDSHNGHLWATPNEGHGATFSFSIPRLHDPTP